jgi:hypothetical protein
VTAPNALLIDLRLFILPFFFFFPFFFALSLSSLAMLSCCCQFPTLCMLERYLHSLFFAALQSFEGFSVFRIGDASCFPRFYKCTLFLTGKEYRGWSYSSYAHAASRVHLLLLQVCFFCVGGLDRLLEQHDCCLLRRGEPDMVFVIPPPIWRRWLGEVRYWCV